MSPNAPYSKSADSNEKLIDTATLSSGSDNLKNGYQEVDARVTHPGGATSIEKETEACVICLEAITERAITVPCNHYTFDFLCLVSWLQEHPSCPLCKTQVTAVQYDWRSPWDFLTFQITPSASSAGLETWVTSSNCPSSSSLQLRQQQQQQQQRRQRQWQQHSRNGQHEALCERRSNGRQQWSRSRQLHGSGRGQAVQGFETHSASSSMSVDDLALSRRRQVYRHKLYSLHVGCSPYTRHREFTPATFNHSAELQSRARAFIRRELQVFDFSTQHSPMVRNREVLLNFVMAILRRIDVKDASGRAETLLSQFLGRENTLLFLHELHAWLKSDYTSLTDWDREVQYPQARSAGASP